MSPWPKGTPAGMNAFYGDPDRDRNGHPDRAWENNNLTTIIPPYQMVLAWDTKAPVRTIRVHEKCANSLLACLRGIANFYGTQDAIEKHRMHLYGGCYNFRLMRGGSSLSIHSWGAAIDLDPERNAFGRRWSAANGMIPKDVVDIFRREGWTWGGNWRKPDAMHFQAADI